MRRRGMQQDERPPRRVVVVDDHDIVCYGVETLMAGTPDLRVVGAARSLQQAAPLIAHARPDLVVADLSLPGSAAIATARTVVRLQAPRPVLVLSMHEEMLYGRHVLALGARGYVHKSQAPQSLLLACREVLDGLIHVSPALVQRLLRDASREAPLEGLPSMSLRELEVLGVLRQGKTTKEIAHVLCISVRAVDQHRTRIKERLGLKTKRDLLDVALAHT